MIRRVLVALLALFAWTGASAAEAVALPPYRVREGLQGSFKMKGSDSVDPLIRLWITEFEKLQPKVAIEVDSPGSNTAPPALISGQAQLGHMSREMSAGEIGAFTAAKGHPPTRLVVAMDALAVFVQAKNPLKRILLDQVDAIYSCTRRTGWDRPLERWGDLGLRGPWRELDIHLYGRDENSGSRIFFMEHVLGKGGQFRKGYQTRDQFGVIEAVAKDPAGIGYGPLNYANPEVRMLPVVALGSAKEYLPTLDNILNGKYPLTRKPSIYVDKEPGKPFPEPQRAFLEFILSREGQRIVQDYGSVAIPADLVEEQRRSLGE